MRPSRPRARPRCRSRHRPAEPRHRARAPPGARPGPSPSERRAACPAHGIRRGPGRPRHDQAVRRSTRLATALGLLVAVSTLLRFWGGTLIPIPWINPDEIIYGELGRSLYRSGEFRILGRPTEFISL